MYGFAQAVAVESPTRECSVDLRSISRARPAPGFRTFNVQTWWTREKIRRIRTQLPLPDTPIISLEFTATVGKGPKVVQVSGLIYLSESRQDDEVRDMVYLVKG